MSTWLLTPTQPDGRRHVVPGTIVGDEIQVLNGHVPHEACWCEPRLEDDYLLVHNDPECGGTNA